MMTNVYDYFFHFNPYQNLWVAFRRDDLHGYGTGKCKTCIKSTSIKTLIEIINKTKGDTSKLPLEAEGKQRMWPKRAD